MKDNSKNPDISRNRSVDIARGIAMICIVLGHLSAPQINRVVYTFHVPVFFLVSGYFFRPGQPFLGFLKRKAQTLLVPYAFFSALIILLAPVINELFLGGEGSRAIIRDWAAAALYGAGSNVNNLFGAPAIGALWFLPASFWGILFLWLLQKIDCRIRAILPGVLFFIACISAKYVWLPFSLQAGCCALFYQYAGFLYKRLAIWARDGQDADAGKDSLRMLFHETGAAYIVFAFAAWFGFIRNFQSFWLVRCETGRGASDVFGSLCACSCVFFVSYILEKNKYVSAVLRPVAYLGKNSIYMLGAHILELNFFPWQIFKDGLHKWGMPVEFDLYVVIAAKFLWIIPASVLLSRSRFLKKIFGQFG